MVKYRCKGPSLARDDNNNKKHAWGTGYTTTTTCSLKASTKGNPTLRRNWLPSTKQPLVWWVEYDKGKGLCTRLPYILPHVMLVMWVLREIRNLPWQSGLWKIIRLWDTCWYTLIGYFSDSLSVCYTVLHHLHLSTSLFITWFHQIERGQYMNLIPRMGFWDLIYLENCVQNIVHTPKWPIHQKRVG